VFSFSRSLLKKKKNYNERERQTSHFQYITTAAKNTHKNLVAFQPANLSLVHFVTRVEKKVIYRFMVEERFRNQTVLIEKINNTVRETNERV
jgi:hypothetical protein